MKATVISPDFARSRRRSFVCRIKTPSADAPEHLSPSLFRAFGPVQGLFQPSSVKSKFLAVSNRTKNMMTLCFAFLFMSSSFANQIKLYVAPDGKESNPGTKSQPLATLEGARDAVRKIDQPLKKHIVVEFATGTYHIKNPVKFDDRDSGRNGHKVVYRAAPGAKPVLTGGTTVEEWTLHDKGKNIYRAKTTKTPFRQVYVENEMATRARHPNRKSLKDNSPYWECKVENQPSMLIKRKYWSACEKVPEGKRSEIEVVMISHWYHQRVRVGAVKKAGKNIEITPVRPRGKFTKKPYFYKNNGIIDNPFYFENAYEFIDADYEWYQDSGKGVLYMAFPRGVNPEKVRVEVPLAETLIDIEGTPESPVRDVEFRGFYFQLTNWNDPSHKGVNMTQAAQAISTENPPPMISARHARRLAFRQNFFLKSGGQGLELYDADFTDIESNYLWMIAANGIVIDSGSGRSPKPDMQSTDVAIWNNDASTCGSNYSNGMFIFANNVKRLTIAHNHIHDLPYSGIQVGQQPGGARGEVFRDVGCGENTIINNLIHDCNQIHGDGGGIYTLGGIQEGTVISGNYVHNIKQPKWSRYHVSYIYLDNNSSKITVKNNVVKGGKAEARNGSKGNFFSNNTQKNPAIEKNAGIKKGYHPRSR